MRKPITTRREKTMNKDVLTLDDVIGFLGLLLLMVGLVLL